MIAEVWTGIATAAGMPAGRLVRPRLRLGFRRGRINGIDVGLFCSTPAVALTRNVELKRAMEMLLTGNMISAETAVEIGLIDRVVPEVRCDIKVDEVASTIAARSPLTERLGKKLVYEQIGMSRADAYDRASKVIVDNMLAADAEQGISAFLDKRKRKPRGEYPRKSGCAAHIGRLAEERGPPAGVRSSKGCLI